jgi:hypothetical protein
MRPAFIVMLMVVTANLCTSLRAQLAITEVMSQTALSTNGNYPDYWELTNFGEREIDVTCYRFEDRSGKSPLPTMDPFSTSLRIGAGKSVIFMRCEPGSAAQSPQAFSNWWGAANLSGTLQEIRCYDRPGLSEGGDGVVLRDRSGVIVDAVTFGPASDGQSFTYDPGTGFFGSLSFAGVNGALAAAASQDIGSVGRTSGPIPLSILEEPPDQETDPGGDVSFSVIAAGMPRPWYQWRRDGTNIPGQTSSKLSVANVQLDDAGEYQVVVSNYFGSLLSRKAVLRVNTNCACARVTIAPVDASVFPGQPVTFSVEARGYPPPIYQWDVNNANIPGATNRTLTITDSVAGISPSTYKVTVRNGANPACTKTCVAVAASAVLTVTRRPLLKITELMAYPRGEINSVHKDWFEVTNDDTNSVNLQNYKFGDNDGPSGFANAFRITNSLWVQPGESVIFVKSMNRRQFIDWWGPENLPAGLQVVTFGGFSLDKGGESLFLWNPGAVDGTDALATAGWATNHEGVSVEFTNFCDEFGCLADYPEDSVFETGGAFGAAQAADFGSPGYNSRPLVLGITHSLSGVTVRCRVTEGRSYRLRYSDGLSNQGSPSQWMSLAAEAASSSLLTLTDPGAGAGVQRFYRLEELP